MTTDPRCLFCERPYDACRNCPVAVASPRCQQCDVDNCEGECGVTLLVARGGGVFRPMVARTSVAGERAGRPGDEPADESCGTSCGRGDSSIAEFTAIVRERSMKGA
jgi:hypothetical protein